MVSRIVTIVALIVLLLMHLSCSREDLGRNGKTTVLRLEPTEENPRNSEGDFIKLKDGRIAFIYTHFTDGSDDDAGAYLAGRLSNDNGETWSEKDFSVLPNEGNMNIMSVSLLRLENGNIALFYLRKNSGIDCVPIMRISKDEALSWGSPILCVEAPGYYVMNNDRAVQLKSGRIILPLALHNTPEINEWFNGRLLCYYSDDEGKTWTRSNEVKNTENVTSQEPGIIELNDGRLMLFCRTDAGVQYVAYSSDESVNWTELKPGNIASPLSPASIERIPRTGDLLLVWNNNDGEGRKGGVRTPFNIALSSDDGESWSAPKILENDPDGWYCYTAVEFVGDFVLLAHCAGNRKFSNGLETTQITRLRLDWIY